MTQPIVFIDKTGEPIDITTNQGFDVFFWYYKDLGISNKIQSAVAKVSIEGNGLVINSNRVEDIYFEDLSQSSQLACDSSWAGKGKLINPELVKNNVLTYGLQTAKSNGQGLASGDLAPNQFGCLRVGLDVASGAIPGQKVKVIFDVDAKKSPSISENKKPAKIETEFLFAGGLVSSTTLPTINSSAQTSQQITQANPETIFNSSLSQVLGIFVAVVLFITLVIWLFGRKKER